MKNIFRTNLVVLFAAASLSIASAKTYQIAVPDNTQVAGTPLKPGDYGVKVNGTVATFEGPNHNKVEATGVIQSADTKFDQTRLEVTKGADGFDHIIAIDLGGTKTKIAFNN
jgi:hypothetical protein